MLSLQLHIINAKPEDIMMQVKSICPEVHHVLDYIRRNVAPIKERREIYPYQAACLYALSKPYNQEGMRILEIGTALGYSAAVIASAAPLAKIVTLNPKESEVVLARQYLQYWPNVTVVQSRSQDYLKDYHDERLDLIFVDGDHAHVKEDLPWWDMLNQNGLMLFHDYSPEGSGRPCPPVYGAVKEFAERLGQPVTLIVDDKQVGMLGIYREEV